MDLLILLTYGALCFAAFRVFNLPVNGYSVVTAVLGGALLLAFIMLGMNYNHPYSTLARSYFISTPIVPAVPGRVTSVPVAANVPLKGGEVLFTVDPEPYRLRVAELQARLALVQAQVRRDQDRLDAAEGALDHALASQALAQEEYDRDAILVERGTLAAARLDQRQARLDAATGDVDSARAAVAEARDMLAALTEGGEAARVAEIDAQLDRARWDLDQATVRAPGPGYVTQVGLLEGVYAVPLPLRPVMVFVTEQPRMVAASFRQISTERLAPGLEAEVAFHGAPGEVFSGRVHSVLPAIAAGEFQASGALIAPEDNARPGRMTVLIELDESFDPASLPRGAAGVAAVYTEHLHALGLVRRVLLRMTAWTFYLSFEH